MSSQAVSPQANGLTLSPTQLSGVLTTAKGSVVGLLTAATAGVGLNYSLLGLVGIASFAAVAIALQVAVQVHSVGKAEAVSESVIASNRPY